MVAKNKTEKQNVAEKMVVRFANRRRPKKANQITAKLSAVCCPAFSLA